MWDAIPTLNSLADSSACGRRSPYEFVETAQAGRVVITVGKTLIVTRSFVTSNPLNITPGRPVAAEGTPGQADTESDPSSA